MSPGLAKRDRDEQPLRVRRPLGDIVPQVRHAEPHVPSSQQRATASQLKKSRKVTAVRTVNYDALEVAGKCAERSKEQVDALEKMLHSAMPPRVVLDNSFAGLRNAIADEIEGGMETQWMRGVQHGEYMAQCQIEELQNELLCTKTMLFQLQQDNCENVSSVDDDLAKFLSELPEPSEATIDLEAMTREIESLTDIIG